MAHVYPLYKDRIIIDPEIMVGKPVVKGTRIPVELVLKRLAQDLNVETLLRAYPRLSIEDIRACIEYAHGLVEGEVIYPASTTQ
jgi:uncharacterized protein (DUF433 family)